jgi:hypothetical protein
MSFPAMRAWSATAAAVCLALASAGVCAAQETAPAAPPASTCEIAGRVTAGNNPLPGVAVTAANTLTGKKAATSTDINGAYLLPVPASGRYVVRAELSAFASLTKEVVINAANCRPRADMEMTLLSRARAPEPQEQGQNGEGQSQQVATALSGSFQNLQLSGEGGLFGAAGDNGFPGNAGEGGESPLAGMPQAGLNPDAPTESVTIAGAAGQTNDFLFGGSNEEMRQRIEEMRERARQGGFGQGGPPGRGGLGGGFGGGPMIFGGRRGRFDINRPHGALFYSVDDSTFDAKPYSLTGAPTPKADYRQQRFGGVLGGPLKIPHIYDGGSKTFFFLNYSGNRAENPYDVFSTVPTLAERGGDFSQTLVRSGTNAGLPVTIYNPATGQPFANNQIRRS